MTWIDWVIVAILGFSALQGLRRGALAAAGGVIGVLLAYVAASYWYVSLASAFGFIPLPPPWQATIAFLVLFLAVNGILAVASSLLLGSENVSPASRMLGVAGGMIRGLLLSAAVLAIAMGSPVGETVASDVTRSAIAASVAEGEITTVEWLNGVLPPSIRLFGGGAARF